MPPARIAGDSCARTTWENAAFTDPWQLARASAAFRRQNLQACNRLSLRETAPTLLSRLQGRF